MTIDKAECDYSDDALYFWKRSSLNYLKDAAEIFSC